MSSRFSRNWHVRRVAVLLIVLASCSGCGVYFNTFFNANKAFKQAERTAAQNKFGGGGDADYKTAIEKCLKITENYPKSAYYDDALFILAVSYYRTKQFERAERRFLDLQEQFPKNKYAPRIPLFLAQTRRELKETDSALALFREVATGSQSKSERAEASLELGRYYATDKQPLVARPFLLSVRDSLGSAEQRSVAQEMLAEGYLATFEPEQALGAFQEIARSAKDHSGKFHANRRAVEAAYGCRQIALGQSILTDLIRDKENDDSLGVLRLKLAEGYEIDESPREAMSIYRDLADGENKLLAAEANYRLGLIFQFDMDDLAKARIYYDQAVNLAKTSVAGNLSTQRLADITKLQQMTKQIVLDSTATQSKIDGVARNAYDLADLYWFKLNEPDSAIRELSWIIDSLQTATIRPEAMLKRAGIVRELTADSVAVDSLLRQLVETYPKSKAATEGRIALGLPEAEADTADPRYLIHRAESLFVDAHEYDSARGLYQQVIDRFPKSDEAVDAEFALIWITDQIDAPGDSSVAYAYQEFLDSFPSAPQATWIRQQLSGGIHANRPVREQEKPAVIPGQDREQTPVVAPEDNPSKPLFPGNESGGKTATDLEANLYLSVEGDTIVDLPFPPDEVKREFEFPSEAYVEGILEYNLIFHVLLDFSGRVIQDSLRAPSPIDELNRRAKETVDGATFNATRVATEVQRGAVKPSKSNESAYWFVYRWRIPIPRR